MENQGTPIGIINLIRDIYQQLRKNKNRRKTGRKGPSQPGDTLRRLLEPITVLLFNIVMNEIIKDLKGLQGYSLGDENVNTVCYADDATLVADNEDDLQRLLYRFSQSCAKYLKNHIRKRNLSQSQRNLLGANFKFATPL